MYVNNACGCLYTIIVIYLIYTFNNNFSTIISSQFSRPSVVSSESESEIEADEGMSDDSSQAEDPTISSRKTLFKGKGKGEGKSSAKATLKGEKHLQIAQKVRHLLQYIGCCSYMYMCKLNGVNMPNINDFMNYFYCNTK